jgi:hypothetical protein
MDNGRRAKERLDACENTMVTVWDTPQPSRSVEVAWSGQHQFASLRSALHWIKDEGEPGAHFDIHVHLLEGDWIPDDEEMRALLEQLGTEGQP